MYDDPIFWLLTLVGVLLTGISKSGFAGGAGVVAVPLMATQIPVSQAIVIMLPLLLVMDIRTIRYYFEHANRQILRAIIPAALLGILAGGTLLGYVADRGLELALAVISILFASWHRLTPWLTGFPGSAWLWGTLSGITSTLIHAGGPPINIYFLGRKLDKLTWLASAAIFFGCMNLVKIVPYSLNPQWTPDNLSFAIILVPIALFGVYLGKQLQGRIAEKDFVSICRGLLFVTGVMLLIKAF